MDLNTCIKRAQKGDKNAFGKLKKLYYPETVFLAARFLLDQNEAYEAADSVFAAAEGKLARLKDPELFERWLYWCTARECRERLRERTPALFAEKKGGPAQDPTLGIPRKGERIPPKKREQLEKVVEAVDGLPVLQRFPFLYSRLCGYTAEETAAFLGLSTETVAFRVGCGEAALYEALHTPEGVKKAGLEDMIIALREYPLRYIRPAEEELDKEPLPEEEPEEEPPEEEDYAEEEEEREEPHFSVLPLLIVICSLLLAALIFFLIWTLKDNKRKKNVPGEASFRIEAPTAEPGKADVTAVPRSAITAPPTDTPAPTDTPEPTLLPPDGSGLEYQPEQSEWFKKTYRAFICVQGTMNVRKGPTTKYKSLGTMSAGQEVIVYGARDSWYLVEYEPGKLGWASGKYILALPMFEDGTNENLAGITPPGEPITGAEVRTVGAFEGTRLYRDPSQNATYIENVEFGTKVCLLCFDGDWIFVNEGGKFGWMKKDAFDTSNTMDVSSGAYHYVISPGAVFEGSGSAVRVTGTLYKTECLTPANMQKFLAGETVKTKKGTKIKPEFTSMEKSTREIEPGLPAEVSLNEGELRFVYDEEQKLYMLYTYEKPKLYSYKKLDLVVRPDATVTDRRFYAVYDLGAPSFGTVNADNCFVFNGNKLGAYVEYVDSYGMYDGLSGTLTVRNGAVCDLTIESGE